MRELKFRYVCKDMLGRIFSFIKTIEEMERAELNINTYGRIQEIISRDQYTRLKDKNGKEIYEGDIVRDCFKHPDEEDTCHYLGPSKKGIIKWDIGHAGFYIETDRWENDMYLAEITGPTTSHQIMPEWIEIIGNVFENLELMEATDQ